MEGGEEFVCWQPTDRYRDIKARAREFRWRAEASGKVTHPDHGSVVVPMTSKLSAIENAAEYWGCNWADLTAEATVTRREPEDGQTRRPKEFCKGYKRRPPHDPIS